jgi:hypothetical protein
VTIGVILAVLGAGYPARAAATVSPWTLMVYLRTDGGLAQAAAGYVEQFCAAAGPDVRVVAQIEDAQRPGEGRRLVVAADSAKWEPGEVRGDMGSAEAFADFLRWAQDRAPAQRYALVILAHGDPPSGELEAPRGSLRAEAVAAGLAQPGLSVPEVVFFDCCYTGSLQTASSLAGKARYLVASTGLLYAPGLPWGSIVKRLSANASMSGRDLTVVALEEARRFWAREALPAGLVIVDLRRVPELELAVEELATAAIPVMEELVADLTAARGRSASWGPRGEIVEVGAFAAALAQLTPLKTVAECARAVGEAADAATVAVWSQHLSSNEEEVGGLGIDFPLGLAATGRPAGGGAARAGSWERLMSAYSRHMRGQMQAAAATGSLPRSVK